MSKTKKLFASTASVALVAAAIVPAASAAQLNDIEKVPGYAKEAVQFLADNNILKGDENGNFNPAKSLSRAEAAQVLMNALDLKAEGTEEFSDVSAKDWFYDAVVATSPEIFNGDDNGKFNPKQNLTREAAAKVLVDAYGFTGSADLSNFADASKVSKWATSYVAIAVENEIISGKGNLLAPQDKITRAEFATMVKRAMDKVEAPETPEVAVESVTATNGSITVNFDNELEAVEAADFKVTLNNGTTNNEVTPSKAVLSADKKSVVLTVAKVEQTSVEQNVVASVSYKDAEAKAAKAFKVEAKPAAVENVSAVTPNEVTLTLGVAVEKLTKEDVVVTNKAGEKQYVKSVEVVKPAVASNAPVAATQTTQVKVTFYDDLKSNDSYTFNVKVGAQTLTKKLDFTIGEPSRIEFDAQVISTSVNKLSYKVFDKNGVDITANNTVSVNSDKANFTASKGQVTSTLKDGEYAFVELTVVTKDGKEVTSNRVKVSAQNPKAVDFAQEWTLASNTNEPDYKAEDYKQDKTVNMGTPKYLDVNLVDQFGDDIAESTIKYETLDASVAVVDANSGKVTPRKEGKALIKASIMDGTKVVATKTFELNVVGEAKLAGINVDSTSLNVTAGFDSKLNVTLVDQFGNDIKGDVKIEVVNKDVATVSGSATQTATEGKLELTVNGLEEGTTTIKLTAGDFTKNVTVNVVEAGEVANYEVEGFKSELLVKDASATDTVDDTTMTLKVNAVDAKGLTVEELEAKGYTVSVKDKDGKEVHSSGTITAGDLINHEGPFTVTVKVGALTVFEKTLTVKDNRTAPKFSVKSNDIAIKAGSDLNTLFDGALDFGTATVAVTDVDFVSDNEAVINDDDAAYSSEIDGTATIYVDTVNIEVTYADKSTDTFELKLNGEKFDVLVDKTNPTNTAPVALEVADGADMVLAVATADANPYSLEVDHSLEGTLPEFTLYADADNVWGSKAAADTAAKAGLEAKYDSKNKTWTITAKVDGNAYKALKDAKSVKFYTVVKDVLGNVSGSMGSETEGLTANTTTVTFK